MSALYASIGSDTRKTQATSRGHRHIDAHVRGWDSGVEVEAFHDEETGDRFHVYGLPGATAAVRGSLSARSRWCVLSIVRRSELDGAPLKGGRPWRKFHGKGRSKIAHEYREVGNMKRWLGRGKPRTARSCCLAHRTTQRRRRSTTVTRF